MLFFKLKRKKKNMEDFVLNCCSFATLKNGFVTLYDLYIHVENKNKKLFFNKQLCLFWNIMEAIHP